MRYGTVTQWVGVLAVVLVAGCARERPRLGGFCQSDDDCPQGQACIDGTCAYTCSLDADCPEGYACDEQRCKTLCKQTDDCGRGPGPRACVRGLCEFVRPPGIAVGTAPAETGEQESFVLSASESIPYDPASTTYRWTFVASVPKGFTPQMSPVPPKADALVVEAPEVQVVAPQVFEETRLFFRLSLRDDEGHVAEDEVSVVVRNDVNEAPVAVLKASVEEASAGDEVVVDASATYDPNPADVLVLTWSVEAGGSAVPFEDVSDAGDARRIRFEAPSVPQDTSVVVTLTVSDGHPDGTATASVEVLVHGTGCDPAACALDNDNPCLVATCDGQGGCILVADVGKPCDDGDACTQGEACGEDGTCGGGQPVVCDDGDACTTDACEPETGCVHEALVCDDGLPCTLDACDAAEGCVFAADDGLCDDGNGCTDDVCDPQVGCTYVPNAAPCEDGDPCTLGDACQAGACQAGDAADCDDEDACTDDGCDESGDCVHEPVQCDDDNPCTDDACDALEGCVYAPVAGACDDGDACTILDACADGTCMPGYEPYCNDDDPCTDDYCDHDQGCVFPPLSCDDGIDCTEDYCDEFAGCDHAYIDAPCDDGVPCSVDLCTDNGCWHEPYAPACDDGDACTVDSCNTLVGCVHAPADGAPCDDGDACTVADACVGTDCVGGQPADCDDGVDCTVDACDPEVGCTHDTADCACVEDADCDDGNPCTDDTCEAGVCALANNAAPCDDGDACTVGDTCAEGACASGEPVDCDDGDACTADSCDAAAGCTHAAVNCDDGNACTADSCDAAAGCTHAALNCDDGDACTADSCDPATGCTHAAVNCDDGDACTADGCDATTGCTHGAVDCDDGDPCTDDACDPATGCTHTPVAGCQASNCCDLNGMNTAGCDDPACEEVVCSLHALCCSAAWDSLCAATAAELCAVCGAPPACTSDAACDDGVGCTTDVCDVEAGGVCVHTPDDTLCDDGDPCTVDACDATAGCSFDLLDPSCGTGDCCAAHPNGGCGDVKCRGAVCAWDPACCTEGWTQACADQATVLCAACGGAPECTADADCDDGIDCTVDGCNLDTGTCANTPDDAACDDGDVCTLDACDPAFGCVHEAVANCGPGDCCAAHDTPGCADVECPQVVCAQDAFCCDAHWDSICADEAASWCAVCGATPCTTDADCDDGDACTLDACGAAAGVCTHTDVVCDDGIACTVDACDPASGCSNTPDDALCVDGNPCTTDVCDPASGCTHTAIAGCVPSTCCVGNDAGAPGCDDPSCQDLVCSVSSSCCDIGWDVECQSLANTLCAVCGATPECTADADCPDDGIACTTASCDLATGTCNHTPDDGSCDDGDPCTFDACEPIAGGCVHDPVTGCTGDCCAANPAHGCNDPDCQAIVCGADSWCCEVSWDTACAASANTLCTVCGATPECTADADCPDDGIACTVEACNLSTGTCTTNPDGALCDDGNPCTTDACDPSAGCTNTPIAGCVPSTCCVGNDAGAPGCDDPTCQDIVCGLDPACCSVAWSAACQDAANASCAVCGATP